MGANSRSLVSRSARSGDAAPCPSSVPKLQKRQSSFAADRRICMTSDNREKSRGLGQQASAAREKAIRPPRRCGRSHEIEPCSGSHTDEPKAIQVAQILRNERGGGSFSPHAVRCALPCGSLRLMLDGSLNQRPELPKPFSAREESSRLSTVWTAPVRIGTGIIWAIFSPAAMGTAVSPRLVIRIRTSPR
jgi:hypothetical protein